MADLNYKKCELCSKPKIKKNFAEITKKLEKLYENKNQKIPDLEMWLYTCKCPLYFYTELNLCRQEKINFEMMLDSTKKIFVEGIKEKFESIKNITVSNISKDDIAHAQTQTKFFEDRAFRDDTPERTINNRLNYAIFETGRLARKQEKRENMLKESSDI